MGERNQERKEQYKRVRTDFEDLEIEDKALFLLEATVSTVARGIEQIGRGFAEEFDKACRRATEWQSREASAETTNGATAAAPGSSTGHPASDPSGENPGTGGTSSPTDDSSSEPDSDTPA